MATVTATRTSRRKSLEKLLNFMVNALEPNCIKAPAAFAQAVNLAATGGRVVVAGTRGAGDKTPGFDPDRVVYKELTILGTLGVDYPAYAEAMGLLASRRFPFEDLPRETVGLEGVTGLIARLAGEAEGAIPVHGVVVPQQ